MITIPYMQAGVRAAHLKARGIAFDWEIHPDTLEFMISVANDTAEEIKVNLKLQKARKCLGLQLEVIRRLKAFLLPRLQREVDPDIRELVIMPDPIEDDGED